MAITPMEVEKRLMALSVEIDQIHKDLTDCEHRFHTTKAGLEIAMARARMELSAPDRKYSVALKEDIALHQNAEQYMELAIAEAQVKAARANASRVKTQVDIARSISVSVRASLEII